jgi:hypothetical protein
MVCEALLSVAVLNHITRFGLLHDPGKTCAHDEIWARHRFWEPSVPPSFNELSQGFGQIACLAGRVVLARVSSKPERSLVFDQRADTGFV